MDRLQTQSTFVLVFLKFFYKELKLWDYAVKSQNTILLKFLNDSDRPNLTVYSKAKEDTTVSKHDLLVSFTSRQQKPLINIEIWNHYANS